MIHKGGESLAIKNKLSKEIQGRRMQGHMLVGAFAN